MANDFNPPGSLSVSRRDFLGRCAAVSATLIIPSFRAAELAVPAGHGQLESVTVGFTDYRLTPHYPAISALDEITRPVQPGLDAFPAEKYAAEIESVLMEWSKSLRQSPADFRAIGAFLSPGFEGSALEPVEDRRLRSDPALEICWRRFSSKPSLGPEEFLQQLPSLVGWPATLITAEFKVPNIAVSSGPHLLIQTSVWYDLVATGSEFYRQELVGYWELEWERIPDGKFRVRKWRVVEETRSRASGPIFVDITPQTLGANPSYQEQMLRGTDYWRTVLDGACGISVYGNHGVAVGDIDDDGFDDLYVCQPAGLPNRLYRNRRDGTFEDVTESAGVGVLDDTPCALFVDVDNDGHQDLVVVRATGPLLFQNEGGGRFRLKPDAFRFAQPPQGTFTGASFGDYDRDGWLDVYFCLYSYYQGLDQYRYPTPYYDAQNGPPNFLFRNNRDGTFSDVTTAAGLQQNNNRYSFDCAWCDFNADGWPDLYVVNDFGRKNLYRNNGDGTFTDVAEDAGVLDIGPGMSSCWVDYDNDGKHDLYVSDMWEPAGMRISNYEAFMRSAPASVRALYHRHAKGNSLFHNEGNGQFKEQSTVAGVEKAGWSWSCYAWDFDHDGYPELYIANGMISGPNRQDLEGFFWRQVVSRSPLTATPSRNYEQGWNAINDLIRSDGTWNGYQRNVFFANNRDGTFSHVSGAVGLDFPDDSRAFALSDFDHDGRLELFLKNRTGPQLRILRNVMKGVGDSICFRLQGRESNRDAVGAEITVETERGRQVKFIQAGSGFVSQHTKELFFGVGKTGPTVRAQVRWPNGRVQQFENIPVNHRVDIEEGNEGFRATPFLARAEIAEITSAQGAVPPPLVSETWLIEPLAAPDFALCDLAGEVHALRSFRGRPVLLNFWATGCPPSREELQVFRQNHSRWLARGLQLVAINVDESGQAAEVRNLASEMGLKFPILLASDEVAGIYNLVYRYVFDRRRNLGIPTSFLIDEEGSIVKVFQGPLNPEQLCGDSIPRTAIERVRKALPFPGKYYAGEFHRNNFTLGVAFSQHGFMDQAIASFQLVLRDYPNYAEAHYNLGTLYLKKQMRAEARKHLLEAIRIWPDYPNALNNLGLLALDEGRTEEAIGDFQQAIGLSPDYVIALQNLGNLYRHQGRLGEAQRTLEAALQVDTEDPEVNYSLAMVFAQKNDTDQARRYFQKAVNLRPDYPAALNNLGVLHRRTGKLAEAIATFEQCIRVAPAFDQPYMNLAEMYMAAREWQKAQEVLRRLLEQQPNHAHARKLLEQLAR